MWVSKKVIVTLLFLLVRLPSPRIFLTASKPRKDRKVVMKTFCRSVTFWYGLVGFSSRLGTGGSKLEKKSISEILFFFSSDHFTFTLWLYICYYFYFK